MSQSPPLRSGTGVVKPLIKDALRIQRGMLRYVIELPSKFRLPRDAAGLKDEKQREAHVGVKC